MAKPLRDVAPKAQKEGKLAGVKKSTTEPADISDFNASSGNQDFAKDHKIEKHADRVGNDDGVYKAKVKQTDMSKHGYKKPQDAKIYEAKCNMTEAGTMCEVHGDKACSSDKVPEAGVGKRGMIADKKKLNEVLTKKTTSSKVIDDFVNSDNKMFKGDSKKQRIKRALGAYYGMRKEEAEQIDEISDALALSTAKGALKSMNSADVNTDKGLATFQKRTKTQALALDKMNPDYKRLKAKVGTSEANAKDAAYQNSIKEDAALKGYGPTDRGTADGYAGRKPDPHKYIAGQDGGRQRVKLTDPNEVKQYMSAHKDDSTGSKVFEALATTKKKKTEKESAPGDTPIRMPSGNVGDSDTGRV